MPQTPFGSRSRPLAGARAQGSSPIAQHWESMLKKRAFVGLVFIGLNVLRVSACAERDDAEARLEQLDERLAAGELPGFAPGPPFDGEWTVVTLSMSSMAAMNLAAKDPTTRARRAEQVSGWVKRLSSERVLAHDTAMWGHDALATLDGPEGHAGVLGHLALAMDVACLLGGERDVALHEALVTALARRVDASPTGLIETYPAETYVPDNVVVLAAVMQFDACVGEPRHGDLLARWKAKLFAQWVDSASGLLVFAPGQPARGSGAAWNSLYLALIDEPLAQAQSELMWKTFGDTAVGGWLGGFREWPVGHDGRGDVDSGPLIAGVSPAATGFALGDATLRGRPERAAILRTAELVGVTWNGRYLTAPLVGDAITLAARTLTRWPPGAAP